MTRQSLALVAHDARKDDLVAWTGQHIAVLEAATLFATGNTGRRVLERYPHLDLTCLKSGPLGGDQQLGAMIAEGRLDMLIFFVDPLTPMPHDVDVKALMRLAIVYDLPMALNAATADRLMRTG